MCEYAAVTFRKEFKQGRLVSETTLDRIEFLYHEFNDLCTKKSQW